jgi:hypothetical protein
MVDLKFATSEARIQLQLWELQQEQRIIHLRYDMNEARESIKAVKFHRDDRGAFDRAGILALGLRLPPLNRTMNWEVDDDVADETHEQEENIKIAQG